MHANRSLFLLFLLRAPTLYLVSLFSATVSESAWAIQRWHFRQTDYAPLQLISPPFPPLNTQSGKGKMSAKQTSNCHMTDNYRKAAQKCQYVESATASWDEWRGKHACLGLWSVCVCVSLCVWFCQVQAITQHWSFRMCCVEHLC